MTRGRKTCGFVLAALLLSGAAASAAESRILWQIGTADNDTAEFALAPDGLTSFKAAPLFIVGHSDPKRDWPYIQPGPEDRMGGGSRQAFHIQFAVAKAARRGECRLVIDLADTHPENPPKLRISVNGEVFFHETPAGGGGGSERGNLSASREHRFAVTFPVSALKRGPNKIVIATLSGSWMLYDWVGLETPAGFKLGQLNEAPVIRKIAAAPIFVEEDGALKQIVQLTVRNIGPPVEARVLVTGTRPVRVSIEPGDQIVDVPVPAVQAETPVVIEVKVGGKTVAKRERTLAPVRRWTLYLLPHSHVDIGYTQLQTKVERDHWDFFEQAIEASRKTAEYPPGARFKWNTEVLWAVDSYLEQASPQKKEAFIEAVKKGWIGLDALYGNELTALCRPEELVRLLDGANRIQSRHGLTIDSAMITDVPGYTWGIVTVLADSGVKYWSIGPNRGHRIGHTLSTWGDRPFYWLEPSGERKVLCWVAGEGYSLFHRGRLRDGRILTDYLKNLEESGYPYDIAMLRYSIGGDNGPPDPEMSEFVRDWNTRYAYPQLVIATTSEMFRAFEQRHGDKLPTVTGDFTPYWEDGAASSARETALNRASAERLVQAERLWAMLNPDAYPAERFHAAWRNVVLYDEHTWGAHNSISEPESEFATGQWQIKQAFALDGDRQSRELLDEALKAEPAAAPAVGGVTSVQVFNTASWPRTDLVIVPVDWKLPGDLVKGPDGEPVPSQRLSTGELAFLAQDVTALGAVPYTIHAGEAHALGSAVAEGTRLSNGLVALTFDKITGAITSMMGPEISGDLVSGDGGFGLNEYLYVAGRNPNDPQRNAAVTIRVKESGPLVASLVVESEAPGCRKLTREVRVVSGLPRVDIVNTLDKENVYEKEAVHLAFPFNVPDGVMRLDVAWAVVRPEIDQMKGACKNYFTVQRWVDVSNDDFGVTWATVDAPLIEIGAITADPIAVGWLETIEPSSTLFSYVMNNYWETNYKASQEGPVTFRYSIQPHGPYDAAAAARFGTDRSQPLVIMPVEDAAARPAFFKVEPPGVVVSALKPSQDGQAWILRLFGASGKAEKAALTWERPEAMQVRMSNLAEVQGEPVTGPIDVPPYGMVTLRIARP